MNLIILMNVQPTINKKTGKPLRDRKGRRKYMRHFKSPNKEQTLCELELEDHTMVISKAQFVTCGFCLARAEEIAKSKTMQELWDELGDVPVDEQDNIEENFYHFTVGESKYSIWYWLEETFDIILSSHPEMLKLDREIGTHTRLGRSREDFTCR